MNILNWFRKPKRIAFLDGDQPLPGILHAYDTYLKGIETHLVRLKENDQNEPKILRKTTGINKIYLSGYTAGKEVTDKFIVAYIQKAVHDGYKDITVVSSDYDFIDAFKMSVQLNPSASNISFRMIIPDAIGKLKECPNQISNIQIIKM